MRLLGKKISEIQNDGGKILDTKGEAVTDDNVKPVGSSAVKAVADAIKTSGTVNIASGSAVIKYSDEFDEKIKEYIEKENIKFNVTSSQSFVEVDTTTAYPQITVKDPKDDKITTATVKFELRRGDSTTAEQTVTVTLTIKKS